MTTIEAKKLQPGQMVRLKADRQYVRIIHVDIFGKSLAVITKNIKVKTVTHNDIEFDTRPPETLGKWE